MSRAGMSDRQILTSLTTNPARRSRGMALIEPGLPADLTVLDEDPAKDPAAFSHVRYTLEAARSSIALNSS